MITISDLKLIYCLNVKLSLVGQREKLRLQFNNPINDAKFSLASDWSLIN